MQNTEEQLPVSKKSSKGTKRKGQRALSFGGLIIFTIAVFGVGWLSGSGRIQVRSFNAVSSNSGLPDKLDYSSVDTIYRSLKDNYDGQLDEAKLLEGLKSGLAEAAGDPYTEYFNPEAAEEFSNSLEGSFEGIGAELDKNADGIIIIVSPIAGSPAEAAGVRAQDIIAEVDGESTSGKSVSEVVSKIRGDKGTEVKLMLIRDGKPVEVAIVRDTITIDSVKTEIRDGVGIMTISRFGNDTVELARKAADEFKAANVKAIVLDMRGNPGGYLDGAVNISSLWLDKGATVLTERRDNVVVDTLKATGNPTLKGIKTVVLIDEGSASASEITAGALKDNGVAVLIGQKTFGKGSVQQPISLKDGSLLKVTIARWFTPGGKNIDKEGIEPDQKVEITADNLTNNQDPQLDAALVVAKS